MNYIYGALLLHSAGKPVDEDNMRKVVESTGKSSDDAKIKALVAALDGVNIEEVISKAAMPVASPVVAAAPVAADKKEEKNEEDLEKKAQEAAEGLSSLFG